MVCNILYLKRASGLLKLTEIISVSVVIGIFRGVPVTFGSPSHANNLTIGTDSDFFASGVMVTSLIMTPLLLVCYLRGHTQVEKTLLEVLINMVLCALIFISGSLALEFYHAPPYPWKDKQSEGIVLGVFCYIAGSFYFADVLVAMRNYCKPSADSQC